MQSINFLLSLLEDRIGKKVSKKKEKKKDMSTVGSIMLHIGVDAKIKT